MRVAHVSGVTAPRSIETVTKQVSARRVTRNLYESMFERYIFFGGASALASELAKPPMPVTAAA
jgi:hypothetical protein